MKLIDADALLEQLEPYEDYDHLVKWIKEGSFDPPKFSAEAVDYCRRFMDSPKFGIEYKDLPELIDHLIQYLEQLKAE